MISLKVFYHLSSYHEPKIFIAVAALIVIALVFVAQKTDMLSASLFRLTPNPITVCSENNGTWDAVYQECEYISNEVCTENKGIFKECTSACRHNSIAEICTMQCVPVCHFKNKKPKDIAYTLEKETFFLDDGIAESVQLVHKQKIEDMNNDKKRDFIVILSKQDGKTNLFYTTLALSIGKGYQSTNAIRIGDRVDFKSTKKNANGIVVHYADRYPWETIEVLPTVAKIKQLSFENGILGEIKLPELSQGGVRRLAIEKWSDCKDDRCTALSVNILDGNDGIWYLDAFYDGINDDSVSNERRIASVQKVNGEWEIKKEIKREFKCHEDRGQQEYEETLCD